MATTTGYPFLLKNAAHFNFPNVIKAVRLLGRKVRSRVLTFFTRIFCRVTFTSSGIARWLAILLLLSFLGSIEAGAQAYCPIGYYTGPDSRPVDIAMGDFNGDGRPDLVTANLLSHNVTVRLNDGRGALETGTTG